MRGECGFWVTGFGCTVEEGGGGGGGRGGGGGSGGVEEGEEAEVGEAGFKVGSEEDVGGFEVAVDRIGLVEVKEASGHILCDFQAGCPV